MQNVLRPTPLPPTLMHTMTHKITSLYGASD